MTKPTSKHAEFSCRLGCGACCIAPSISSAIPGMPNGKPSGTRCIQLDDNNLCKLFGKPERPKVCLQFKACPSVCGDNQAEALENIYYLERLT
ncbi:YkgJ family cysteine cluster protein [Aliagarivorans marinus]|uniref:YkgJ family cysteine cluster protein n=1 Tax=Aliagarivorans marinus TaxID=561965 RepID=UPI00068804AD|nr:YkgJ family cysteine cluster protein [Aliagarivorans marinus]